MYYFLTDCRVLQQAKSMGRAPEVDNANTDETGGIGAYNCYLWSSEHIQRSLSCAVSEWVLTIVMQI